MKTEFREIGRRECPEEMILVYTANESGNHIVRHAYQGDQEFSPGRLHIFGNPVRDKTEFERIMSEDKQKFLGKYWRP